MKRRIFFLVLVFFSILLTGQAYAQDEITGLYCTSSTTWNGVDYLVTGNITVTTGCELHIENSTIEMNASFDNEYSIYLQGSGALWINDSNITSKNKYWSDTADYTTNNSRISLWRNASAGTTNAGLYINNSVLSYLGIKNHTVTGLNLRQYGGINLRPTRDNNDNYGVGTLKTDSYINNTIFEYMFDGIYIYGTSINMTNVTFRYMGIKGLSMFAVTWYNPTSTNKIFHDITFYNMTGATDIQPIYVDDVTNLDAKNLITYNFNYDGYPTPIHEWNMYADLNNSVIDGLTSDNLLLWGFNGNSYNVTFKNITADNNTNGIYINANKYLSNVSIDNWSSVRRKDRTGIIFDMSGYADRLNWSNVYWENKYPTTDNNYVYSFKGIRNSTWKNISIVNVDSVLAPFKNWAWATYITQYNIFENISIDGATTTEDALSYLMGNITNNIYRDWNLTNTASGKNTTRLAGYISDNKWINVNDRDKIWVSSLNSEYAKYSYVDVKVTNSTGFPISGAAVSFTNIVNASHPSINRDGITTSSYTTDASGHTALPIGNNSETVVLMNYLKNFTAQENMTYSVTVSKTGYTNNTTVTISPTSGFYRQMGLENTYQNTTQIILTDNIISTSCSAYLDTVYDGGCPDGNCGIGIFVGNCSSISQINSTINNISALENLGSGEWLLHAHLRNNQTGNVLYINDSDVTWLKINSSLNYRYVRGFYTSERVEINNTKITSWNTTTNDVQPLVGTGASSQRSTITIRGANAKMNISNSNLSFLGWNNVHERGVVYTGTTETTGCPSGSVIYNSTFVQNFMGINLYDCANNITIYDSVLSGTDYGHGLVLGGSYNNTVYNNTMTSIYGSGLWIGSEVNSYYPSYNNNFTNNIITSANSVYNGGAVYVDRSYNNTINGGSIINSGSKYSYSIGGWANNSNKFNNTGFSTRKLIFTDSTSAFEYDNGTGVWIKSQPNNSAFVTRTIQNWTKPNISFSEIYNSSREIQYNVSGLSPNTAYDIYNDSNIDYSYTTDASGVLTPFNINFSTSAKTIKILSGVCNWCRNVNVTVHANNTPKQYSPAGNIEGNMQMTFIQYASNDWYTYNLTIDTATSRQYNESSNNGSIGITVYQSNLLMLSNYSVKTYWDNGTKIQDLYIHSNISGWIVYNQSGFEYPRNTVISEIPLSPVVYVATVIIVTVIIGGVIYYFRRLRKAT